MSLYLRNEKRSTWWERSTLRVSRR